MPSLNSGPSEATVQTATQTKPEPLHPLRQHSIPAAARDDDEPIVFYRLLRAFGCVRSGVSECVRLCFVFSVVVLCSVLSFFFWTPRPLKTDVGADTRIGRATASSDASQRFVENHSVGSAAAVAAALNESDGGAYGPACCPGKSFLSFSLLRPPQLERGTRRHVSCTAQRSRWIVLRFSSVECVTVRHLRRADGLKRSWMQLCVVYTDSDPSSPSRTHTHTHTHTTVLIFSLLFPRAPSSLSLSFFFLPLSSRERELFCCI